MIAGVSRDSHQNPPYSWNLPQGSHTWTPAVLRTCVVWANALTFFPIPFKHHLPKISGQHPEILPRLASNRHIVHESANIKVCLYQVMVYLRKLMSNVIFLNHFVIKL